LHNYQMIIKKITVLLVDTIIFFISAVIILAVFFYVKDVRMHSE